MTSSVISLLHGRLTKEEVVNIMSKIMDKYDELKDLSNMESFLSLMKVFYSFYHNFKLYRNEMCDVLLRKNYFPITSTIIGNLTKRGYFRTHSIWLCTNLTFSTLLSISDCNQKMAAAIVDTDIPKFVIANILYKPFIDNLHKKHVYDLIYGCICIIHNTARHPGNQAHFDSESLKMVLVDLIRTNDCDLFRLIAMLTLAVLVDDTEKELLNEGKNVISSIIGYIKTAQRETDGTFNGCTTWELINGLRCISVNDNMKRAIVDEGGIAVLIDVLTQHPDVNDIEKSLATILNLCFDDNIKNLLETDYHIKRVIQPFQSHQSSEIRRICEGIIWLFDKRNQRAESNSTVRTKWEFDIFLSYSWANKDDVLNIKNELAKSGIRVWIDKEQMKESTLDSMAHGIENSKMFVMCASEDYRTSQDCHLEADYAYKLEKPIIPLMMKLKYKPTGWLGLLCGSKKYYEFSERRVFQETITDLLKNITTIINDGVEESIVSKSALSTQRDHSDCSIKTQMNSSVPSEWSKDDVGEWLAKSGLNDSKAKFSDIDGSMLISLKEMSSLKPELFIESLRNELGMNLIDFLKFDVAIKKLDIN